MAEFIFCQCHNEECRFRFPVADDDPARTRCPRCGSATNHVAAALPKLRLPTVPHSSFRLSALLDNIRSIHNVGSMFRTADGAGVEHLYLCGITATPEHPRLAKAALGAQDTVPWSYGRNALDMAQSLRQAGYCLWALERVTADNSTKNVHSLFDPGIEYPLGERPVVLIVGNERAGVDPGLIELCDHIISLPMYGEKPSLNAAVAFGIAIYCLRYLSSTVTTD